MQNARNKGANKITVVKGIKPSNIQRIYEALKPVPSDYKPWQMLKCKSIEQHDKVEMGRC